MRALRIHAAAAEEAVEAAAWYEKERSGLGVEFERDAEVFVIAFSHQARRPGYWRSRLQSPATGRFR